MRKHTDLFQFLVIMHRSNRNLTIFGARGVGNLTGRSSRGGEFDLCLGGVGKLNRKCQVSSDFFFSGTEATNSYKHVF